MVSACDPTPTAASPQEGGPTARGHRVRVAASVITTPNRFYFLHKTRTVPRDPCRCMRAVH